MIGRPAGNVLLVVLASTFDLDGLCARRTRAQMTLLFAMMNSTRKQLIANMVTGGHRLYTKLTMGSQLRVETTTTRTVGTLEINTREEGRTGGRIRSHLPQSPGWHSRWQRWYWHSRILLQIWWQL